MLTERSFADFSGRKERRREEGTEEGGRERKAAYARTRTTHGKKRAAHIRKAVSRSEQNLESGD